MLKKTLTTFTLTACFGLSLGTYALADTAIWPMVVIGAGAYIAAGVCVFGALFVVAAVIAKIRKSRKGNE